MQFHPESVSKYTQTGLFYFLPIFTAVSLFITISLELKYYASLGVVLYLPLILSPLLSRYLSQESWPEVPSFKLSTLQYILLLLSFIWIVQLSSIRPVALYFIIAGLSFIILLQTMSSNLTRLKSMIIIVEEVVLYAAIVVSATLKYYYSIGGTDTIAHTDMSTILLQTGKTTPNFGLYQDFYFWHGGVAVLTRATDLRHVNSAVMLLNLLAFIAIILSIISLVRRISSDLRLSLLSGLVLATSHYHLLWGISVRARNTVILFEVLIVLIFLTRGDTIGEWGTRVRGLALVLGVSIVIFHPVSLPFFGILCGLLYIVSGMYDQWKKSMIPVFAIFVLVMIGYWVFFVDQLVLFLFKLLTFSIPNPTAGSIPVERSIDYAKLTSYLHYTLVIFFSTIAAIHIRSFNRRLRPLIVAGFISLGIIFPGPANIIPLYSRLNLHRFAEHAYFLAAIATTSGLYLILRDKSFRQIGIVLFAILVIISAGNPLTAADNPLTDTGTDDNYLTLSEVEGFEFARTHSTKQVHGDYITFRWWDFKQFNRVTLLAVNQETGRLYWYEQGDIVVYRENEHRKKMLMFQSFEEKPDVRPAWNSDSLVVSRTPSRFGERLALSGGKIYDNSDVELYSNTSGTI